MQMILMENELKEAILKYVEVYIGIRKDSVQGMEFIAGKGENGFRAVIDAQPGNPAGFGIPAIGDLSSGENGMPAIAKQFAEALKGMAGASVVSAKTETIEEEPREKKQPLFPPKVK